MPDGTNPAPVCQETNFTAIDGGTMCLAASQTPSPVSFPDPEQSTATLLSPAFKTSVNFSVAITPDMTWNGFWRLAYDRLNESFSEQANLLLRNGFTETEVRLLVENRNRAVLEFREPLSPFGQLYSEILKPAAKLKNLEQLLEEKGTLEAVLKSAGKTRAVVDNIGVVSRVVGSGLIALDIAVTGIVIAEAPANERGRVVAREVTGAAFSTGGGSVGMWGGCALGMAWFSPSLAVPAVGEGVEGAACLVGSIIGGFGIGWGARRIGQGVGEGVYDVVTEFHWN